MTANPNDGATLWVWQERDSGGSWGAIGLMAGKNASIIPLSARAESIARGTFAEVARAHHAASGHPVRLAKFTLAEIVETLT